MRATDFLYESAVTELAHKLPGLEKHDYTIIDNLIKQVAKKYQISHNLLKKFFKQKYKVTPDYWIKNKLDENSNINLKDEVDKFVDWVSSRLQIKTKPKIILSIDTEEAQQGHHTGQHTEGDNNIWVYIKNRNLVDILRTVAHELTHVRQGELGMIQPGDSYPGSPIELLADMVAGKVIKIYGKNNHYIFQ